MLNNGIEAVLKLDGTYDAELSAHITAYQDIGESVTLELEFVDSETGTYDRTEIYAITLRDES